MINTHYLDNRDFIADVIKATRALKARGIKADTIQMSQQIAQLSDETKGTKEERKNAREYNRLRLGYLRAKTGLDIYIVKAKAK